MQTVWVRFRRMFALAALALGVAYGQTAPQPRFEVASIKPGGDIFRTRPDRLRGRFRWTTQLAYLIGYAYRLDFSQVSGSQPLGAIYTIEATFDPAATDNQVRSMIQALLADRFKMQAHRVTTEAEGYALLLGKGGIKIREAPPAGEEESNVFAHLPVPGVIAVTGRKASMSQLAQELQRSLELPVWDRTGLAGNYDFTFRFARDFGPDFEADAPSLAAALRDLGLALKKDKGTVDSLVVDHIEKPSEN